VLRIDFDRDLAAHDNILVRGGFSPPPGLPHFQRLHQRS
jgi:hypothetical protein